MSKHRFCPECKEGHLGDRWCAGRKLQQYCRGDECYWAGEPRTPEQRPISLDRQLLISDFSGWCFTLFDRYGHIMVESQSYHTEAQARKGLAEYMKRSETDKDAGPYTAVLHNVPTNVTIQGVKITRYEDCVHSRPQKG